MGRAPTVLETPCRVWGGAVNGDGYAILRRGPDRTTLLHRYVYEECHQVRLPRSTVVMHRCDNPPCFRLDHLVAGTMADNQRDMVAKGRADTGRRVLGEANASIIRERFAAGELARTLAAEFGVSKATIWDVVRGRKYRSADGPISPQTWRPADTDANRASVAALMDSGMSNRAIGRMLDISHHAVAKIKKGLQDG